jgi:hypothetical protein
VAGAGLALSIAMADAAPDPTAWIGTGIGIGCAAWATYRTADPAGGVELRATGAILAVLAVNAVAYGLEATPDAWSIIFTFLGLALTIASLAAWHARRIRWQPLGIAAFLIAAEAVVVAASVWPRRDLILPALLAAGAESVAAGIILRRPLLVAAGPVAALAAWFTTFTEPVAAPEWYTTPIGLALLAEVEIGRWWRRHDTGSLDSMELAVAEVTGVGLLAIVPLTQMFSAGLGHGAVAFGTAVALFVWGLVTGVGLRAISALVLATVTAVLWIAAVAAAASPPSAFLWIMIAGVGVAALLVMALVESYRSRTGHLMSWISRYVEVSS